MRDADSAPYHATLQLKAQAHLRARFGHPSGGGTIASPSDGSAMGTDAEKPEMLKVFFDVPHTDSLHGPWKANPALLYSALHQTDN